MDEYKSPSLFRVAMEATSESPRLWFERLYTALRLPFWVGVLLFGPILFLAFQAVVVLWSGSWAYYVGSGYLFVVLVFSVLVVYAQLASRRIRHGAERIEKNTRTVQGGKALDLTPVVNPGPTLAVALPGAVAILLLYAVFSLPESLTLTQRLIISIPYFPTNVFVITFLWVDLSSLYAIFKVGQLELALKPFTEDRVLGLKPLGRFSMQLVGHTMLVMALIVISSFFAGLVSIPILGLFLFLTLLSLMFFFLPLLPLRRKLHQAKAEVAAWLGPRYTSVFQRIKSDPEGEIGQGVYQELMALEKIQRDVREIHNWPFDTGMVVRLSVIASSVTAIVISRIIALLVGF